MVQAKSVEEIKNSKCPKGAEVAVPWAGKIMKGCKEHANSLCILGEAMGSPLEARLLPPNKDNCEFGNDDN